MVFPDSDIWISKYQDIQNSVLIFTNICQITLFPGDISINLVVRLPEHFLCIFRITLMFQCIYKRQSGFAKGVSFPCSLCSSLCCKAPGSSFFMVVQLPVLEWRSWSWSCDKEGRHCHLEWHRWSLTILFRDKVRLGLGIEQRVCRLPAQMRTKGAIRVGRTELLPAQPLQLTEKAAGEAQDHHYAKTLLSGLLWGALLQSAHRSSQHKE